MKKEWFLDCYCGQQFAALTEDGLLAEFAMEKATGGALVGNVYKGKVTNVLTGMNAAFVNCGLKRNCYLSIEETYTDYSKYDGTMGAMNPVLGDLKAGDEVVVQITKPPRGNKGAKVTTHLSFVGKRLIYLPNTDFLGISRKIVDENLRAELLATADKLRGGKKGEGYILRTQAPLANQRQLKAEANYLKKLYRSVKETFDEAPVGTLLYSDDDLPVRVMRDSIGEEISSIRVGNKELFDRLLKLAKLRSDIPERKLVLYTGNRSMMKEYGISPLLKQITDSKVPLENGGYLVIEPTEALTVVDVNSGGCIGDKNLEDTVFNVNLSAAREIARQVRLRNVGGIVIVDFIDMLDEEHKLAVTAELEKHLAQDSAKCHVLPMSDLCLTQFTRKRVGNEVRSYLVKPCPYCEGNSHVAEDVFVFSSIRDELLDCFAEGYKGAVVHLNEKVMKRLLDENVFTPETKTLWREKRIYLVPHKTYREDCFTVRGDNSDVMTLPDKAQILY